MAKQIIFLAHGMGSWPADWSKTFREQLKEHYNKYQYSALYEFDKLFTFEELKYNDLFDKLRKQWAQGAQAVLDQMAGLPASAATNIANLYAGAGGDEFVKTHVLDVLLYRFVDTVGAAIRETLAAQITDVLHKAAAKGDEVRWSVIAHSLGTSVVHDTLHTLYSPDGPYQLPTAVNRVKVLMMVANVSRVLENRALFGEAGDVYRSIVRPTLDKEKGACDYYVNVRHQWDPIPMPQRFNPADDWPDIESRLGKRYRYIPISAFASADIHGLEHYFGDPRVHIALFRLLNFPEFITQKEEEEAILEYERNTPLGKFEARRKQLEALFLGEHEKDWAKIVWAFFNAVRQEGG
jgi:hypothetical protein